MKPLFLRAQGTLPNTGHKECECQRGWRTLRKLDPL